MARLAAVTPVRVRIELISPLDQRPKDEQQRYDLLFQPHLVHLGQSLILLPVKVQDRVCELSQSMQCSLVCAGRKSSTRISDALIQILALCAIVVAQHGLHDRSHQRERRVCRAEDEGVMCLLQVLEHRQRLGAPVLGGDLARHKHEGNKCTAPKHPMQIKPGVLPQSLPCGDAVLNPLDEIRLIDPSVFLIGVELREVDRLLDGAGLFRCLVIGIIPLQVRLRNAGGLSVGEFRQKVG